MRVRVVFCVIGWWLGIACLHLVPSLSIPYALYGTGMSSCIEFERTLFAQNSAQSMNRSHKSTQHQKSAPKQLNKMKTSNQ